MLLKKFFKCLKMPMGWGWVALMKSRDGTIQPHDTYSSLGQAVSLLRPQNAKVTGRQTSYDLTYKRDSIQASLRHSYPPVTGKEK